MSKPTHDSHTRLIAGCMTGTSLDGLDAALVAVTGHGLEMKARFIGMVSRPLGDLRDELRHFASGSAAEPIRFLRAARRLGELHAEAVGALCEQEGCKHLDFVVAHGQTIWHAPGDRGVERKIDAGVSWQLFDPWPIVRKLKAPVCYDLRQADLIAGGQGAPVTPIADAVMYGRGDGTTVVVNLGGICNVTIIGDTISGEDIGPCNLLIDGVVQRTYPGTAFDKDGRLAASGKMRSAPIFKAMMESPFFHRPAPRTTGREDFSSDWLDRIVALPTRRQRPQDMVASAVTAVALLVGARIIGWRPTRVVLAGGGARNRTLVEMIRHCSPPSQISILLSDEVGIPCEAREAMGFAVLGALSQDGVPITLPQVTGAKEPGRAGAWVYP